MHGYIHWTTTNTNLWAIFNKNFIKMYDQRITISFKKISLPFLCWEQWNNLSNNLIIRGVSQIVAFSHKKCAFMAWRWFNCPMPYSGCITHPMVKKKRKVVPNFMPGSFLLYICNKFNYYILIITWYNAKAVMGSWNALMYMYKFNIMGKEHEIWILGAILI